MNFFQFQLSVVHPFINPLPMVQQPHWANSEMARIVLKTMRIIEINENMMEMNLIPHLILAIGRMESTAAAVEYDDWVSWGWGGVGGWISIFFSSLTIFISSWNKNKIKISNNNKYVNCFLYIIFSFTLYAFSPHHSILVDYDDWMLENVADVAVVQCTNLYQIKLTRRSRIRRREGRRKLRWKSIAGGKKYFPEPSPTVLLQTPMDANPIISRYSTVAVS